MDVTTLVIKGVKGLPRKVFGPRNDRLLKGYRRLVPPVNELEQTIRGDYDERFAKRVAAEHVDDAPEAEQETLRQQIRVELSEDLREHAESLRERMRPYTEALDEWWRGLKPSQRVEEYYRAEYRKRDAKVIAALDEAGVMGEAFAVLREASRRTQDHRHFDCQLIGGRVLFEGKIAEMRTG